MLPAHPATVPFICALALPQAALNRARLSSPVLTLILLGEVLTDQNSTDKQLEEETPSPPTPLHTPSHPAHTPTPAHLHPHTFILTSSHPHLLKPLHSDTLTPATRYSDAV